VRVSFLGVRGSTPAPGEAFERYGGHTSCVALAHDGEMPTLLLDAGTGIRRAAEILDGAPFRGSIFLSHLHWDHVHGLPFFSGSDRTDARTSLFIPDQGDGSDPLEMLARGMSPPHFPVRPDELRGDWSFTSHVPGEIQVEGFTVQTQEIPHKGGRTYGFRISDESSTITYMPDHCPDAIGEGPDGLGEYHPAALALCQDADVLVHDAQLVREELAAEGYFGHAAAEYAVALARRTNVQHTVLFHHKPDRTDDQLDEIARRFDDSPRVTVAKQSTVLDL
jgi:phosphoribosyl 1,2-cyclic phosphodiesterase